MGKEPNGKEGEGRGKETVEGRKGDEKDMEGWRKRYKERKGC